MTPREILASSAEPPAEQTITGKALAYLRVSTSRQADHDLSLPAQADGIRRWAEAQGVEIVDWYGDRHSAFRSDDKRPEFAKLLDHAKRDPEITAIIVHDSSRFVRNAIRSLLLRQELRECGVEVISTVEPRHDSESVSGLAQEQ